MDEHIIGRRDFMKVLGFGGGAALALPRESRTGEVERRKPNVILVITDDQGWGDIHSHGNVLLDTPVMDRLAASGARFDRFYVSPVCAPTRASLLTGRYSLRTGTSGVTRGLETMRAEEVTIAEILKGAGYMCGCFGKWHNGAHYPYHPTGQGFDEFLGFCAGHWNNYFDTSLEHNGRRVKTTGYINEVLTEAALGFIEKNSSRPFFCYLPYNTPHSPLQVPDRYFEKYKARGVDDELASIYGMCENLDDNLDRLLGKLDELNLADDTIVLFLTDNGANSERFNGGMKGFKGSVYEGGTRVPCFMRWPGHIQPGTVIGQISAHIDLLPTIVELLGIEKPDTLPLDGVSLAPLLRGQTSGWADRMIFTNFRNNGAVRTQRYRLVLKEGSDPELYDMEVDPGEEKNIAREYPEVAGGLRSAYEAWYKDVTRLGNDRLPIPVGYEVMKTVELPAPECYFEGDLKYKGLAGYANDWVTGWTSTESRLYWDIDVVRSGTYEITLFYTCPKEDIGAKLQVEVAGEHLEGIIEKAHDPEPIPSPDRVPRNEVYEKVWAPLTLGTMKLQKGRTRLYVKALTKPGNSVMDLKSVRIRRVD